MGAWYDWTMVTFVSEESDISVQENEEDEMEKYLIQMNILPKFTVFSELFNILKFMLWYSLAQIKILNKIPFCFRDGIRKSVKDQINIMSQFCMLSQLNHLMNVYLLLRMVQLLESMLKKMNQGIHWFYPERIGQNTF